MLINEKWLPVEGYEEKYEVSSAGRVRSLLSSRGKPWRDGPRVLKARPSSKGVLRVQIGRRDRSIQRLVLTTFIASCPAGYQAAHLDGNLQNNQLRNLAWVTTAEKARHKLIRGTQSHGEKHGRSKLSRGEVAQVRSLLASGESQRSIARRFNVSQSAISLINNGRNWGLT